MCEKNHTTCSSAFKSSQYCSLKHVNTEAAEQTNKVLRSITSSTTFMSPRLYMKALTLFTANLNLLANNKKKWIVWNDFYWIHNLTFVPEILCSNIALILVQRSNIFSLLPFFTILIQTIQTNWTGHQFSPPFCILMKVVPEFKFCLSAPLERMYNNSFKSYPDELNQIVQAETCISQDLFADENGIIDAHVISSQVFITYINMMMIMISYHICAHIFAVK